MRLTPERIAEIRERIAKATPGPWHNHGQYIPDYGHCNYEASCTVTAADYRVVADIWGSEYTHQNADLIAHAPEDLPACLSEIAALKKDAEQMAALLQWECRTRVDKALLGMECHKRGIDLPALLARYTEAGA